MSDKKKYVYNYDRICEVCGLPFTTQRYSTKICSPECVKKAIAQSRTKYTDEQINKAIEMKLSGATYKDIEIATQIKKPTQCQIFKQRNIKLTDDQKAKALRHRWDDHAPIQDNKKKCSKCGEFKPLDDFHKNTNRLTGAVSACKECYKEYYADNKTEIIERVKQYREDNKEKIKEKDKTYYENNSDRAKENATRWAAANPERRKEIERRYAHDNQDAKNARTARYRAQKKKAMPKWLTKDQIREIDQFYLKRPEGFHVDHIVPICGEDVCGLHVPWNLQYLPEYINESKCNKFVDENFKTGVCHQYARKLETMEEDRSSGKPFDSKLEDFVLAKESFSPEHRDFIERYEWLGTTGYSPKWIFSARINGLLGGVIFISEPNGYTKPGDIGTKYEALISRGATASWTPKNLGSKMVMFACRWMVENTTKRVFFGYSDHSAGEIGTIYQACNFKYLGPYFGSRNMYVLETGGKVSSRYFTKTTQMRRYAKDLGIAWKDDWTKENGYIKLEAIPEDILSQLKDQAEEAKNSHKKTKEAPKSKYVMVLGKDKREKRSVHAIYDLVFDKDFEYPKRRA